MCAQHQVIIPISYTLTILTITDSSCIQPVNGLCYQTETKQSLGSCCSGSMCVPLISDPTGDQFCQKVLKEGENCNQDVSRNI